MSTNTFQYASWRWLVRGIVLLLVVALLAVLPPLKAAAAPLAKLDCKRTYEVKRGDTLATIASKYGRAGNQVVAANKWKKPYTIYVGQRICIPTEKETGLPKLESKYANARAVYFTAGRAEDELLVYTYNYPKTRVLIKVDDADDSARKFYEVGEINVAAVGNGKAWRFKLPTPVQDARTLYICLKDTTTNYLQCIYPRSGP